MPPEDDQDLNVEDQTPDQKPEADKTEAVWRRKFEATQRELQKLQRSQMSEIDRAKAESDESRKRAESAESKLRDVTVRSAIESTAHRLGAHSPSAVARLLDLSKIATDEHGDPVGADVDRALAQLRKDNPWAFGPPKTPGNTGGGGINKPPAAKSTGQSMDDFIRHKISGG